MPPTPAAAANPAATTAAVRAYAGQHPAEQPPPGTPEDLPVASSARLGLVGFERSRGAGTAGR